MSNLTLTPQQVATLAYLVTERKHQVKGALTEVSDLSYAFSLLVQEEQHLNNILKLLYSIKG